MENVRKRMFIVSTVIVLILAIVVMVLPGIINSVSSGETATVEDSYANSDFTFYIVDNADVFSGDLSLLEYSFRGVNFESKSAEETRDLMESVTKDKTKFLLIVNEKDGVLSCEYTVNSIGTGPSPTELGGAIQKANAAKLLGEYNVPPATLQNAMAPVNVNVIQQSTGMLQGMITSLVVTMLLYFAIYMYGYGVAVSVAAEKTSRVMEILITSTKPSSIIIGKTSAMGVLGLLQLLLTIIVGGVAYALAFPKDFSIMGESINLSGFTPLAVIMLIVYFILGYALYAMLSAVAGATVSKAEDVNSAITPISMLSMISFFLAYYPSVIPGGGKITQIVSMIPFTAPFAMPGRLLSMNVPAWQMIISIVLLAGSIILFTWVSIKLYSSAVLHYGKRLQLKDLVSMAKK